jgi:hypothetical protein
VTHPHRGRYCRRSSWSPRPSRHRWAPRARPSLRFAWLHAVPGVVGAHGDAHGRSIPRGLCPPGACVGGPDTLRSMALDPRTPVLVGVGQVVERPDETRPVTERAEPIELMVRALRSAAADCAGGGAGDRLLARARSLRIMLPLSWRYINPGLLVAERLGLAPAELALTAIGGNSPQTMVNQTALAIADGALDVALLAGAECIFTRIAARRDPHRPILSWTSQPPETPAPVRLGIDRSAGDRGGAGRRPRPPHQCVPTFRECVASGRRRGHRRAPDQGVGHVGPVLGGGRRQPLRVVASGPDGRRAADRRSGQPDGVRSPTRSSSTPTIVSTRARP